MNNPVWDAFHQMPPGREFEAYHHVSDCPQAVVYHSHPYFEIYFFLSGHNRVVVEGLDVELRRGDVLIYPPGVMHRNIHLDATVPYERFFVYATSQAPQCKFTRTKLFRYKRKRRPLSRPPHPAAAHRCGEHGADDRQLLRPRAALRTVGTTVVQCVAILHEWHRVATQQHAYLLERPLLSLPVDARNTGICRDNLYGSHFSRSAPALPHPVDTGWSMVHSSVPVVEIHQEVPQTLIISNRLSIPQGPMPQSVVSGFSYSAN